MTNKELIDKLVQYYLTQDPKIVARALASQIIDLNRIWNIETLPETERDSLIERTRLNIDQLNEFIEKGPSKDMKLIIRSSF